MPAVGNRPGLVGARVLECPLPPASPPRGEIPCFLVGLNHTRRHTSTHHPAMVSKTSAANYSHSPARRWTPPSSSSAACRNPPRVASVLPIHPAEPKLAHRGNATQSGRAATVRFHLYRDKLYKSKLSTVKEARQVPACCGSARPSPPGPAGGSELLGIERLSDRCTVAPIPGGHPLPLPRHSARPRTSAPSPQLPRRVLKVDEAIRAETDLNGSSWAACGQGHIRTITSQSGRGRAHPGPSHTTGHAGPHPAVRRASLKRR